MINLQNANKIFLIPSKFLTSEKYIGSKSSLAPMDWRTSWQESIISGPTPSPGIRVTVTRSLEAELKLGA